MRLATCIALEVAVGGIVACTVGAATFAVLAHWWGPAKYAEHLGSSAEIRLLPRDSAAPLGPADGFWEGDEEWHDVMVFEPDDVSADGYLEFEPDVLKDVSFWEGRFLGFPDEELVAPLRAGAVARAKFNRGGDSVSLRLDFKDGARAAFKPRQIYMQSVPRREVAAYRINRLLGLETVPPAIGREFSKAEVLRWLSGRGPESKSRIDTEVKAPRGRIVGELSFWIPELRPAKIEKYRLDEMEGISIWKPLLKAKAPTSEKHQELLAQISSLVAFDFIIDNSDRWTGGNTLGSPDGSILFATDNTLSFGENHSGHPKSRRYLERCQRFSKSLVGQIRELSLDVVAEAVTVDIAPFTFFSQ